jgi:hypothetical protein
MSTKPKNRDRRGRRRGGSRRSEQTKRPKRPTPPCIACGEDINDITSALADPRDGGPVHFECAIKAAEAELKPGEGEKVIYLGKGGFAVVESKSYQQRKLKIIRRMDWEKLDEVSSWRKDLRTELR